MLVYDDASFRAERMHNGRTEVTEGSLDASRFSQFSDIVKSKDFAAIQHEHLSATMLAHNPDVVSVDVLREGGTQQLRFANRDDRKSFSTQIEPLLKWFDGTQKLPGVRPSAVKANRCLPDDEEVARATTVASAGASVSAGSATTVGAAAPSSSNPYHIAGLLVLFTQEKYTSNEPIQLMYTPADETSKFGSVNGSKECLLVKEDGDGYFSRIKMAPGERQKILEMRFKLSPEQLSDLKHAMDEPALANSKELILQAPPGLAKEVSRAEVVAVRSQIVQRLLFRAASGITNVSSSTGFRGNETVGGRGNDGSKETAPLRKWMKSNVDLKQLGSVNQLSGECP